MFRRTVVLVAALVLVAAAAFTVHGARRADASAVRKTLRAFIAGLPVAGEHRAGYDRSKFHLWIDADHDGCDTRKEVLIAEAITKPHQGGGCALSGGRWHSLYDNQYTTNSSTFDIDHVVPLAEAWDSGASAWSATQREAYANDLGDPRSLIAVTASSNRSKGDRDPAEWMPPSAADTCPYLQSWVAVKVRWKLRVDSLEKTKLIALALHCVNRTLTVPIAPVSPTKPTTPPTTHPHPSCSPAYPDFCIPPPPPDLNCADVAPHHDFTVLAPDPHHFDNDHDGRGCES